MTLKDFFDMRSLFKGMLAALLASVMICGAASAQTRSVSHSFSPFKQVSVSGEVGAAGFVVDVKKSASYSIDLVLDNFVAEFVQAYVKNEVLYLSVDTKALPSEVRKHYKMKNVPPCVLRATIYTPELSAVSADSRSIVAVYDEFSSDSFNVDLKDRAALKELKVNAKKIIAAFSGSTTATMTLSSDDMSIEASNKSCVTVTLDCVNLNVKQGNNSEVSVDGNFVDVAVDNGAFTKLKLSGKANVLDVKASGTSMIDAINLRASTCSAVLSGHSTLYEAASESVKMDLSGSSTLIFDGQPVFDIVKINSSTVNRYEKK